MNPCPTTGKRGYGSKHHARRAMRFAGNRVRPYLCPACGHWHITNQDRNEPTMFRPLRRSLGDD